MVIIESVVSLANTILSSEAQDMKCDTFFVNQCIIQFNHCVEIKMSNDTKHKS